MQLWVKDYVPYSFNWPFKFSSDVSSKFAETFGLDYIAKCGNYKNETAALNHRRLAINFFVRGIRHDSSLSKCSKQRQSPPEWNNITNISGRWLLLFRALAKWRILTNTAYEKIDRDGLLWGILCSCCSEITCWNCCCSDDLKNRRTKCKGRFRHEKLRTSRNHLISFLCRSERLANITFMNTHAREQKISHRARKLASGKPA